MTRGTPPQYAVRGMPIRKIVNGIDVERQGQSTYWGGGRGSSAVAARTEWLGSTQTRTVSLGNSADLVVETDCPTELLGSGRAASPLALLVASLGASFVTCFVLEAAAANVRIESLIVQTDAEVNHDGPGGHRMRGDVNLRAAVEADAIPDELDRLAEAALRRSPVVALCRLRAHVHITTVAKEAR